ncbi:FecR family protein [Myxococcota bacterium]|nr:FecR family protein [Myxococcota bacterium]
MAALPGRAGAASAVIEALSHVDRAGRWRVVDQTDQGSVFRGQAEDLLRQGDTLQPGDRLVTRAARVQLRLSDGSRMNLSEDGELTLAEGPGEAWDRVVQRAGEVYYRMRSALTVEAGAVETIVEGTRFLVARQGEGDGVTNGDSVSVRVEQGVVRVRRDDLGEGERLTRLRQVAMPQAGPSPGVERWRPRPADLARSWPLGRPRWQVGALATGQLLAGAAPLGTPDAGGTEGGGGLRLFAGLHLPADLRLVASTAVGASSGGSLRVPVGLGLAWQPGALTLAGELTSTLEDRRLLCGEQYTAVHLGGAGTVRYGHALGRRLSLLAELRAGYADGLSVEPALGLGVGL